VASWRMYRQVMELVDGLEQRHVVPLRARVDAILEDVKGVTGTVKDETHRIEHAIRATMDRVDYTADRVRANVRARTNHLVGVGRGIRAALQAMLHPRHQMPAGRTQARLPRWETRVQQAESD
jgi:hypothetical protein